MFSYKPSGVCSSLIQFDIAEDNGRKIVKNIKFTNGCSGNTQGVARLAEGMEAEKVIKLLEGTKCGYKQTSCPDQFARAIKEALRQI